MTKKTTKKTIKETLKPSGITISFTREEIAWLAAVMEDVFYDGIYSDFEKPPADPERRKLFKKFELNKSHADYSDRIFLSACKKLVAADELLKNVDKVLNEGTKVRKVDARKRPATRPKRKSARR